jgi:hypothetical protein
LILLADKKKLQEGKVAFVSVVCGGDLIDYFPQAELSYEKNVDFDLVPNMSKFRAYMRYKSLKPFWDKYHPKEGKNQSLYYFRLIRVWNIHVHQPALLRTRKHLQNTLFWLQIFSRFGL